MTARCTARWILHWATTATTALIVSLLAGLPFPGPAANTVGVLAAAAVGLIGIACAPHPGKARR